jgi:phosphotriesterase-related protein
MSALVTSAGLLSQAEAGLILPHEHLVTDLRTGEPPGFAEATEAAVIELMAPLLRAAGEAGVGTLVECTPVGVGRRADLVVALARAADLPVVLATGVYREPWVPDWVHAASEEQLADWMITELEQQVEQTGVRAGFIKVSAGDEGITECEAKILRAAAHAGRATGAAIGTHTIRGRVLAEQLDIVEDAGYRADRVIWIHAHVEPDFDANLAAARRGAWIEYDGIGPAGTQDELIERTLRMLEAGFGDRVLLSHDAGWYDPAQPGGGTPRGFTDLAESFLPALDAAGVGTDGIRMLSRENPFRAFAR